jgi:signal transduction histidine kinase
MSDQAATQLRQALDILSEVSTLESGRERLRQAIDVAERTPPPEVGGATRPRGRNFYDRLMGTILDHVKRAVSREELVGYVLRTLGADGEACAAECYLVIEALVDQVGAIGELAVSDFALINPLQSDAYSRKRLPRMVNSALLRDVLVRHQTIEFLATEHFEALGYDRGDLEGLGKIGRSGKWICALPLPPGEVGRRARMLLALYPVVGPPDLPSLPRGALQEWRALAFLRVAYDMLTHQLASTRDQLRRQRRELLADLAPGIVNHEINQLVKIIEEGNMLASAGVHGLSPSIPDSDLHFDQVLQGVLSVQGASDRLRSIADAFNNLDRRAEHEPVRLSTLVEEVYVLQSHVFAGLGIAAEITGDESAEVRTDAALLQHVILNVVANAAEAMREDSDKACEYPVIRCAITGDEEAIELRLMNNGPPITIFEPERLFEKGFTTKPRGVGHGLGLHMCRLVMTFLGGAVTLLPASELDPDMQVGFLVRLPRVRRVDWELA